MVSRCVQDEGKMEGEKGAKPEFGRQHRQLRVGGANVGSECVTSLSVRSD